MRSFEEYITEGRQNYIFGGTDDRSPGMTKTFAELELGDKIYFWNYGDSSITERTLVKNVIIGESKFKLYYEDRNYYTIDNRNIDKTYAYVDNFGIAWAIATDFEEICKVLKTEFNLVFDDKNLKKM